MFTTVRRRLAAQAIAVALGATITGAGAVGAATIQTHAGPGFLETQPGFHYYVPIELGGYDLCSTSGDLVTNVGTFRRVSSTPGSGSSVCGDGGNSVQVKDQTVPNLFGRHNPPTGIGRWIDSNDIEQIEWEIDTVALGRSGIFGIEFAVVDAHDQANSFFDISVEGATWSISEREPNGVVHWISILFDQTVTGTIVRFDTRHNDGFGIAGATLAAIPAPPAAFLAIGGFALLIALRRRRPA
jgi:hypothetical protein